MPRPRVVALATMAALALAVPMHARAQDAKDQAAAEALFQKARGLMAAGDFAEACPKLAESQRLDPAVGTLLNLASCYEKNGQLASAWVTYTLAAAAAQKANQQDRVRLARGKAAELESKLPTLTIVVPGGADSADLHVKRDGEDVGRAEWGTPIPVDPGTHVVEASAPGHSGWTGHAAVTGAGAKVTVTVPPLPLEQPTATATTASTAAPSAAPPPPASTVNTNAAAAPPPTAPPTASAALEENSGSGQRIAGLVIGGAGLVGIGLGTYFGVTASAKNGTASANCPTDTTCNVTGATAENDAKTNATASTVSFLAGGALVAIGAVVWLLAPSAKHEARTSLQLVPAGGGVLLRGAW